MKSTSSRLILARDILIILVLLLACAWFLKALFQPPAGCPTPVVVAQPCQPVCVTCTPKKHTAPHKKRAARHTPKKPHGTTTHVTNTHGATIHLTGCDGVPRAFRVRPLPRDQYARVESKLNSLGKEGRAAIRTQADMDTVVNQAVKGQ